VTPRLGLALLGNSAGRVAAVLAIAAVTMWLAPPPLPFIAGKLGVALSGNRLPDRIYQNGRGYWNGQDCRMFSPCQDPSPRCRTRRQLAADGAARLRPAGWMLSLAGPPLRRLRDEGNVTLMWIETWPDCLVSYSLMGGP
jgi:hypothetical protein